MVDQARWAHAAAFRRAMAVMSPTGFLTRRSDGAKRCTKTSWNDPSSSNFALHVASAKIADKDIKGGDLAHGAQRAWRGSGESGNARALAERFASYRDYAAEASCVDGMAEAARGFHIRRDRGRGRSRGAENHGARTPCPRTPRDRHRHRLCFLRKTFHGRSAGAMLDENKMR